MAIAFTETQQPDTALLYDLYKSMGLETGGIDNALFSLKAADGNILAAERHCRNGTALRCWIMWRLYPNTGI